MGPHKLQFFITYRLYGQYENNRQTTCHCPKETASTPSYQLSSSDKKIDTMEKKCQDIASTLFFNPTNNSLLFNLKNNCNEQGKLEKVKNFLEYTWEQVNEEYCVECWDVSFNNIMAYCYLFSEKFNFHHFFRRRRSSWKQPLTVAKSVSRKSMKHWMV